MLGVVLHVCNPNYMEGVGRKIMGQGWAKAKTQDPIQKNK
jgi:hypothetical protein